MSVPLAILRLPSGEYLIHPHDHPVCESLDCPMWTVDGGGALSIAIHRFKHAGRARTQGCEADVQVYEFSEVVEACP